MFFLLEDSTNLREASVTYVSERLASQLNIKKKQLKNSLPQLLKHGIDEDKWKSLQGKWRNKESIRFNTSITPPGSAGSKLDIRLTPVKKQEDQKWMWEGECYNPVDGPSADPRELTNILFEQLFDNLPSAAVLLDFETNRVRMFPR